MRENGTLTWLIADHLGSTSLTVDASGTLLSSLKYTAFGELRSGTASTDYLYTGQRQEAEIGLYFYMSRFFDLILTTLPNLTPLYLILIIRKRMTGMRMH
jgi:hypothetical protein